MKGKNLQKLGEIIQLVSGGTPSKKKEEYWNGNIPWVTPKDIISPRIYKTTDYLTELGAKSGTKYMAPNTICFVVRGMSLAKDFRIALVKTKATFNQDIKAVKITYPGVDKYFLFYWFMSNKKKFMGLCDEAAHGTKRLQTNVILEQTISLPPLPTQRAIASILSAYDDLIENNLRRIRLLEEAAQLIYKEWFVHLRFPGWEEVEVVDGVPEGWENTIIKDWGKVVTGKTPSKKEKSNYGGKTPFIKTPDMHGSTFILRTFDSLTDSGATSQAKKFIPPYSILVSCIGTVGVVSLTSEMSQTNQQINSIVPSKHEYYPYLYFAAKRLKPILEGLGSSGATMTNVNKGKFENIDLLRPSQRLLLHFFQQVNPLLLQILNLQKQNQKLQEARDILLPRLMNGTIDVEKITTQNEIQLNS